MKKIMLSFLLCIVCTLGLTGCDNKINLTKENYDKYLKIDVRTSCESSSECSISLAVRPKSTNFNYNDIKVKVRADYKTYSISNGTYSENELRSIEITSKSTDVAGNSDTSMPLPLNGSFMRVKSSLDPVENFEVIEISGNVSSI